MSNGKRVKLTNNPIVTQVECSRCRGWGTLEMGRRTCPKCGGDGTVTKTVLFLTPEAPSHEG